MNSEKMALVASQKSPAMYRLQNLKAYHRLGSAARQLVKALVVEGLPVARAIADQPNGVRVWNSQPVIDCLAAYGWNPPAKPPAVEGPAKPYQPPDYPPVPELPCEDCGEVGRHTSRHGSRLVCNDCLCRESNIRGVGLDAPQPAEPARPAPARDVSAGLEAIHRNSNFDPAGWDNSVRLWHQQVRDEQDERARLIRQIEAQENTNRWRY